MDRNYSADTEILWGGRVVLSKDGSNGVTNPLLIITLIILFLIEGMMLPYFSAESKIKYIYATILPCYILYVSLPRQEIIRYFKMFAKLLTIASTVVVLCGIFDTFIGTSIGKTIAEFSAADSLIESIRQGRMVSYFGHPLLTSEVMILCFSFNTLVNYCIEKKTVTETVYYSIVSVIGIGFCGSKTGLILIAIEFALLYVNKKGIKYFILVAAAVYWAYGYGLLDTVIGRYGYYIIITFVYGVSASMILPFVSVYTKKYTDIPYVDVKLAVLFMLIGFANNIRIPCLTMINAAGHFKETQWRAILEAVINITVSLLLIKPLGMYGLLIGTICSFAYRTTDIIYYSHKHILNISCKKSVLRVLRVALVIAINVILYKLLVGKYIMNGWGEWIMYAVIASIIVLVTTGLIYFITEKKQFLACMNLIIKRKVKR